MVFVGGGLKPPPVRDFGGGGGSGLSRTNFDSAADDGNSLAASLWHKGGFKTRPYKLRDRDVLPVRDLRDACSYAIALAGDKVGSRQCTSSRTVPSFERPWA